MTNAPDPETILEEVCKETDPERLAQLVSELQHRQVVVRAEFRRLKVIIRNLGDTIPESVRAELDRAYDLDHQYGKALRIAKINLHFRGGAGRYGQVVGV
jgi:hypothetical protein